jgi:DNA polymerase-1
VVLIQTQDIPPVSTPTGRRIRRRITKPKVFYSVDFGSVELVTHSQSCIWIVGWSKLADALNAGVKPHDALGATMMGVDYDAFSAQMKAKNARAKDFRQGAKPGNFGFPGGMGAWKLVLQQRKQGPDTPWPNGPSILEGGVRGYKGLRFCLLIGGAERCGEVKVTEWKKKQGPPTCRKCIECAELIRDNWFKQWPENKPYFDHINAVTDAGELVQHVSKRVRGGAEFCANANSYFQGLAADAAKEALCRVTYEQFCVPSSPLYGSHVVLFQHDELIGEIDEDVAPEGAERVSTIMIEVLREYCPDVKGTAEPTLMDRWYKQAECVRDPAGRLMVWRPKVAA